MKYLAIATIPVAPILAQAKERYKTFKPKPKDQLTEKAYVGERKKEYLLNLAKSMAILGEPLDTVHSRFLEMFRAYENINIEVELIGITEDSKDFSYGVELVFDDTYFLMGYQDKARTQPVYQRIDDEYYEKEKDCPDGDKVGMLKRLTLARVIRNILDKNKIEYAKAE